MCVTSIMFSLIHSEISGAAYDDAIKTELTSSERLKELYELSSRHDAAHIVASALSKANLLGDDAVSEAFKKALKIAIYRDAQREYTIEQIVSLFENAKIPHILLKGSVIKKYYPFSWIRTSCDIDVLVKKEDTDSAMKTLLNAGYVRTEDTSDCDYSFAAPNKVHVELHFTLIQDGELPAADKIVNTVWDTVILEQGKSYCYNMPAEMFIFYHLIHLGKHLLHGGCGIRPVVDLWLLENKMSYDKYLLNDMLSACGLTTLYETVSALGEVWLENREHTEKTLILEKYIINGGTYGKFESSMVVQMKKRGGKIKYILSKIFVSYDELKLHYPLLENRKALMPIMEVCRWFKLIFGGHMKRITKDIKRNNSISKDVVENTQSVLDIIGL